MEPLTWTGSLGVVLNPALVIVVARFALSLLAQLVLGFFAPTVTLQANADGTLIQRVGPLGLIEKANKILFGQIAPLATIFAFPAILLFYLLVTPEIVQTGIPSYMAAFLFVFPLIFFGLLLNSRYYTQPAIRTAIMVPILGVLGWLYLSVINQKGTVIDFLPAWLDLFDISILVVFVSVVFMNAPTVFRIARADTGFADPRLCCRRTDTRRRGVVHHAVGNPAQRTRTADCRFLSAGRICDYPAGNLGIFWFGPVVGKP
ncbi:hypothetical protein DFP92_101948 [Yoonia sediminilitoris]|uniref:Uncharacterized protein n=1 Tax=Yoonia sediminilitoris TaxID=1286148 RepID=A0A2T6KS02_9RHOB|nr:hypothetical protein C8N45_101948 [Yoonia sediminilitoris]RCW99518.1 hypothetical protein DFP92_101948 [Yoonia sediminilitoris]